MSNGDNEKFRLLFLDHVYVAVVEILLLRYSGLSEYVNPPFRMVLGLYSPELFFILLFHGIRYCGNISEASIPASKSARMLVKSVAEGTPSRPTRPFI